MLQQLLVELFLLLCPLVPFEAARAIEGADATDGCFIFGCMAWGCRDSSGIRELVWRLIDESFTSEV